jgi:hypothetical protein
MEKNKFRKNVFHEVEELTTLAYRNDRESMIKLGKQQELKDTMAHYKLRALEADRPSIFSRLLNTILQLEAENRTFKE